MTSIHMTIYLHSGSYDNNKCNNNDNVQELKIILYSTTHRPI